ncbi:hypothetical protein CPT_Madawaska_130 [Staphylococcus phage Madawaska]|nr:hypothetical protein CPT_Madawaska_130 [Staphylococcus phage Madawaska]
MTKYFIDKEKDELIEIDRNYLNRYEYIAYVLTTMDINNLLSSKGYAKSFIDNISKEEDYMNFHYKEIDNDIYFIDKHNKNDALKRFNTNFHINFNTSRMDKIESGEFKLDFYFENSLYKKYFNVITNGLVNKNNLVNEGINEKTRAFIHVKSFEKGLYDIKYSNELFTDVNFPIPAFEKNPIIKFIEDFKDLFFIILYQNNLSVLMSLYEIKYMYKDDIEFYISFSSKGGGLINLLDLIESDENDLFKEIKTEKEMKAFKVRKGFK